MMDDAEARYQSQTKNVGMNYKKNKTGYQAAKNFKICIESIISINRQ